MENKKLIKECKENDKVLADVIAGKVSSELKKKKTFADDLVSSVDTEIKKR